MQAYWRGADVAGIGYPFSHRSHGAPVSSTLTVKDATGGTMPWTLEAGASLVLVLACDLLFRRLTHRSRTA